MPTSSRRRGSSAVPSQVMLEAAPGQQYRFASVDLPGLDAAGPDATRLRQVFAVKAGDPVIAADVIAAGVALKTGAWARGLCRSDNRRPGYRRRSPHPSRQPDSAGEPRAGRPLRRDPGHGRPPFSAAHVWTIARFKRGDRFDRAQIEDLRRALIATTLVAVADIQVVPVDGGRTVDLAVRLQPAPSHTIAGSVGYDTGQGATVEGSWQARNFLNPEGALTLRGVLGTSEQLAARRVPAQQFRTPRPGARPAGARIAPEVRRLRSPHRHAFERHRAAEQLHLAEDVDVELRRDGPRDR